MEDFIFGVGPYILTFLIGLIVKSPYYQKGKKLIQAVAKAIEDDKVTTEEMQAVKNAISKKES